MGGLGTFDEGILYLDVTPQPRLVALHRQVVLGLEARFGVAPWPLEQGGAFHFHVTLATGLSPPALEAARRHLAPLAEPINPPERRGARALLGAALRKAGLYGLVKGALGRRG